MKRSVLFVLALFFTLVAPALAQMPMRPPPFLGGIPGLNQMRAIELQRHQSRTMLYREAIEELRKNPKAADVPDCPPGGAPPGVLCLARPIPPVAAQGQEAAPQALPAPAPSIKKAESVSVPERSEPPAPVRRRLALLVGNNDYPQPIPPLETPIADVSAIASVLQSRYGYETRIIKNAGKAQIIEAVNAIAAEVKPEDSVLLFYAGHGYLMDDTRMGYWIPVDASVKTAVGWISNTDISKLLGAINARQLILISDSCFSGSLAREQKVSGGVVNPDEVLKRRSVLVFSSGGEEPVSDEGKEGHSIFAWSLIQTLRSVNALSPGYEVYQNVHGQVVKAYPQTPQYGAVVSAGHVAGGEYIFEPVSH